MIKVGLFLSIHPGLEDSWSNFPPLGLGYLFLLFQENRWQCSFIVERNLDELIAARPDLVGFSFATPAARLAARQARRVKEALGCPCSAAARTSPPCPRCSIPPSTWPS